MGEILDAFTKAFDADRPDILERLRHAQPLARGPYRRLVNESITEIERLRSLIYEWVEADRNERRHYPSPGADAQIRRIKAEEALRKAVGL